MKSHHYFYFISAWNVLNSFLILNGLKFFNFHFYIKKLFIIVKKILIVIIKLNHIDYKYNKLKSDKFNLNLKVIYL